MAIEIVDFSIQHGDFPYYVSLPEGVLFMESWICWWRIPFLSIMVIPSVVPNIKICLTPPFYGPKYAFLALQNPGFWAVFHILGMGKRQFLNGKYTDCPSNLGCGWFSDIFESALEEDGPLGSKAVKKHEQESEVNHHQATCWV